MSNYRKKYHPHKKWVKIIVKINEELKTAILTRCIKKKSRKEAKKFTKMQLVFYYSTWKYTKGSTPVFITGLQKNSI